MAFDSSLTPAYQEGMKAAVEVDCGLQLVRVDSGHFQDKICDRIIADIRRSQFVIADFTLQRAKTTLTHQRGVPYDWVSHTQRRINAHRQS